MPHTKIEKPSPELLKELKIENWSAWDCDPFSINTKFDPSTSLRIKYRNSKRFEFRASILFRISDSCPEPRRGIVFRVYVRVIHF